MQEFLRLNVTTDDAHISEICRDYWSLDSEGKFVWPVRALTDKYGYKSSELKDLVVASSDAVSPSVICVNCGQPYLFTSRSDFTSRGRVRADWLCSTCTAEQRRKATEQAVAAEENNRKLIRATFDSSESKSFSVENMSLEHAVYFLALVRMNGTENFEQILPLSVAPRQLTTLEDRKWEALKGLYRNGYIVVHEDSAPNSAVFENNELQHFYLDRVTFSVAGPTRHIRKETVLTLEEMFRSKEWPEHWYEEQLPLWKTIVVDEAVAYMTVVLKEHGFTFTPGEKTLAMLEALFEDYSLGQVYNFIWRAAKDAASRFLRERIPRQHATNHAISSVRHQGERAKAEGWDIKNFRRDFRCPEPVTSEILFNTVLQIGSDGFNTKPYERVSPYQPE